MSPCSASSRPARLVSRRRRDGCADTGTPRILARPDTAPAPLVYAMNEYVTAVTPSPNVTDVAPSRVDPTQGPPAPADPAGAFMASGIASQQRPAAGKRD